MTAPATRGKAAAFVAVATLVAAIGVIGYEILVRGCNVDSLGSILGAKLACPQAKEIVAKEPEKPATPGSFQWHYDKVSIRCTIPIQMGPVRHDIDNSLPLTVEAWAMLVNSILPHGDIGHEYECRIEPHQDFLWSTTDPIQSAIYVIREEVEARFVEQGRICGFVWLEVDWTAKSEAKPGARMRRKVCMDNGVATKIEDLN